MLPLEARILALPTFLESILPPHPLPPLLAPFWLSEHLRKQSKAGQMHPARGQAVDEGRRAEACFWLAVRGQGDGSQTISLQLMPYLYCGTAATWVDEVPPVSATHKGQGTHSFRLYIDLILAVFVNRFLHFCLPCVFWLWALC